ncbi:pancreatic lipase-related protein 2-like isoform X1 [Brevipalpus obovatus]|uniref:pancreatic lipase-related protein 2-like isoform X1 n=1 Tax=Brevipalpus obovatus TaxID=246614 RepID=UPI003D9F169F
MILELIGFLALLQPAFCGFRVPKLSTVTEYVRDHTPGVALLRKEVKCYNPYGCFSNTDFGGIVPDLVHYTPLSPDVINVTYYLFTKKNPKEPFVFGYKDDVEILRQSNFNPSDRIKVIIHGFRSKYKENDWHGALKNNILSQHIGYNVIGVDWSGGAIGYSYPTSMVSTMMVGAIVADTLQQIYDVFEVHPSRMHLIGHSLGAHISGFVGEEFENPKIGRITGLDPAGPYFTHNHTDKRLDPSDAVYVEAIHTDCVSSMSLGIAINVAHVDFYPNGCRDQPGCANGGSETKEENRFTSLLKKFACSHGRAPEFYGVDHRASKCRMIAYACESYEKFKRGECSDCGQNNRDCMIFEFSEKIPNLKELNRKYFFDVAPEYPYCGQQYLISVKINDAMPDSIKGTLKFDIMGSKEDHIGIEMHEEFVAGKTYSKVVVIEHVLGRIMGSSVGWEASRNVILSSMFTKNYGFEIFVDEISIKPMSVINPFLKASYSAKLCSEISYINDGEKNFYQRCKKNSN